MFSRYKLSGLRVAPSGTKYDPQSSDRARRSTNLTRAAAWEDDETDLTRRSCNSFVRVAGRRDIQANLATSRQRQADSAIIPTAQLKAWMLMTELNDRHDRLDDGGLEAIRIATSAHSRRVCALRHWMWCRGGCGCGLWSLGRILLWFLSRGFWSVVRWWLYSSVNLKVFSERIVKRI